MNIFVIAGNLTKDPVIKSVPTANGPISKCTFTVALRRPRSSQNDAADFIPCTAWRQDAENIVKFFKKGRKILIQGHMVSTTYTDVNGSTRTGYDWVVDNWEFCDSSKGNTATINPDDYLHTDADSQFEEVDTGTYIEDAEPEPVKEKVAETPAPDRNFADDSLPF